MKTKRLLVLIAILACFITGCISSEKKLEYYSNKFNDATVEEQIELIEKIKLIDTYEANQLLVKIFNSEYTPKVRLSALESSSKMGFIDEYQDLVTASNEDDFALRVYSITRLKEYPDKKTAKLLLAYLHEKDEKVQEYLRESLITISQNFEIFKFILDQAIEDCTKETIFGVIDDMEKDILDNALDRYPSLYKEVIILLSEDSDQYFRSYFDGLLPSNLSYNKEFTEFVIDSLIDEDKILRNGANKVFSELEINDEIIEKYLDLYNDKRCLENPEEYSSYLIRSIYVLDNNPSFLSDMVVMMDGSNEDVSELIDNVLVRYANSYNTMRDLIIASSDNGDIKSIDGRVKDMIMELAYTEYQSGFSEIRLYREQGKLQWALADQSKSLLQSLLDSLKYSYELGEAAKNNNSWIMLSCLYRVDKTSVFDTMLNSASSISLENIDFANYIVSNLSYMASLDYINNYLSPVLEEMYLVEKSDTLQEGANKGIIVRYNNTDLENEFYEVIGFWNMPPKAISIKTEQIRYVALVSHVDYLRGMYQGNWNCGYRRDITVKILDKYSGQIIESRTFRGDEPPEYVSSNQSGSVIGEVKWNEIFEYCYNKFDELVS